VSLERPDPDLSAAVAADEIPDSDAASPPTGARPKIEYLPAGKATGSGRDQNVRIGLLTRAKRHNVPRNTRVRAKDSAGRILNRDGVA